MISPAKRVIHTVHYLERPESQRVHMLPADKRHSYKTLGRGGGQSGLRSGDLPGEPAREAGL